VLDTEIETETDQDRDQTEVLTSSSAESEVLAADRSRYQLSGVEPNRLVSRPRLRPSPK